MRNLRIVIGLVVWVALGVAVWYGVTRGDPQRAHHVKQTTESVLGDLATPRRAAQLSLPRPAVLAAGDPVFVIGEDGSFRPVGEVHFVVPVGGDDLAAPANFRIRPALPLLIRRRLFLAGSGEVIFYPSAPAIDGDAQLIYHATPDSMAWVMETMLPPQKRVQIAALMSDAVTRHQDEILAALRPVIEEALKDGLTVVEQDLPAALARHREELERLGGKYQEELVQKEIVPLVREEIWPVVQRQAEPVAAQIGQQMWDRASLWRFGWRYAYDWSLLPQRDLVRQEFHRFVSEEAAPVLEQHTDQIIALQQQILAEVARNPKVREVVRRNLARVIDDRELQSLVAAVCRETIVDNPRMQAVFDRHWHSDRARDAVALASARLEPTVRQIGELLLGSPEGGITPEFAQVLRNQILGKDRRWLVLVTGEEQSISSTNQPRPSLHDWVDRATGDAPLPVITVRHASQTSPYPLTPVTHFAADESRD